MLKHLPFTHWNHHFVKDSRKVEFIERNKPNMFFLFWSNHFLAISPRFAHFSCIRRTGAVVSATNRFDRWFGFVSIFTTIFTWLGFANSVALPSCSYFNTDMNSLRQRGLNSQAPRFKRLLVCFLLCTSLKTVVLIQSGSPLCST